MKTDVFQYLLIFSPMAHGQVCCGLQKTYIRGLHSWKCAPSHCDTTFLLCTKLPKNNYASCSAPSATFYILVQSNSYRREKRRERKEERGEKRKRQVRGERKEKRGERRVEKGERREERGESNGIRPRPVMRRIRQYEKYFNEPALQDTPCLRS